MSPAKRPHCRLTADPIHHPHRPLGRVRSPRSRLFPTRAPRHSATVGNRVARNRPSRVPRAHRCARPERSPGRRIFLWTVLCRHPRGIRQVGRLLVSRHARYALIAAHRRRALDDHQGRYAQRPRVCICLGAGSRSSHLVRKPLAFSRPLARLLTQCLFLFPSLLFSCGIYTQPVVPPNRAPDMPDRRRTTLKICPMWFSTGKPHPLASQPTLDISVAGASAYNVSDTEVIGDYILYWVGDPMVTRQNEGTLCTIYLVAWKEGWVKEVRLCSPHNSAVDISQHIFDPL